jgi:hypothetical protein
MSTASLPSIGWLVNCEAKIANSGYLDKTHSYKKCPVFYIFCIQQDFRVAIMPVVTISKETKDWSIRLYYVADFVGVFTVT